MDAKFAYISTVSPREDFIFQLHVDSPEVIDLIIDDLNRNLKDGRIEFIQFVKSDRPSRGKHEVSHS